MLPQDAEVSDPSYVCTGESAADCPSVCVSLASCEECGCATTQSGGGPWGNAMDVIICLDSTNSPTIADASIILTAVVCGCWGEENRMDLVFHAGLDLTE